MSVTDVLFAVISKRLPTFCPIVAFPWIRDFVLFSDLPGFQAPHGGTVPPHILVTTLRPDIFIVNEASRIAIIFELTCPWDKNIDRSHSFKEEKYAPLSADLSRTYKVFTFSVEISARGQISLQSMRQT